MKISIFISFFIVFSVHQVLATENVNMQRWGTSKEWKALLHYKPNMFGFEKSIVDTGDFFFNTEGRKDTVAELISFVDALNANKIVGKLKQTTYCAFPERTRFVREVVGVKISPEIKNQKCDFYDRYYAQFNHPKKISLVYSSSYPNNPASMFGHTFLKVHSERATDLLDVGINYAAQVSDDENPFAFFWFGVTGGYAGQWSTQPYYVKVHEYVNFESRDLWEYEINLSEVELKRLLDHIWELETNSFIDYYFFDENCSYQVLAALEAIKPEWNLLKHKIYVIPGESVKYLTEIPGAFREVKFRPSSFKKSTQKFEALTSDEKKVYFKAIQNKKIDLKNSNALVLETVMSDLEYKRSDDIDEFQKNWLKFEEETREARASQGLMPEDQKSRLKPLDESSRPDIGHDSYSLEPAVGYSWSNNKDLETSFFKLKIASAYHDLLNSDQGYTQFAHIDFPWVELKYSEKQKNLSISELGGLETTSVLPRNHLKKPISYKAKISIKQNDLSLDDFHYVFGEGGLGSTFVLNTFNERFYLFLLGITQVSDKFEKGYKIGPGFEAGFLFDFKNNYKLQIAAKTFCDANSSLGCYGENEVQLNQSFSLGRNFELRNVNSYRSIKIMDLTEFNTALNWIYFFN